MKRLIHILIGAAVLGLIGYYTINILGNWFAPDFIQGADINRVFYLMVTSLVVFIVIGGLLGNHLAKRSTNLSKNQ